MSGAESYELKFQEMKEFLEILACPNVHIWDETMARLRAGASVSESKSSAQRPAPTSAAPR
jgi:hypothetical protein